MSERTPVRRGLGRGLGSLIPPGPSPMAAATVLAEPPAIVPQAGSADWIGRVAAPEHGGEAGELSPADLEEATETARSGFDVGSRDDAGLSLDAELAPVEGAYFALIPVGDVSPNPRQPREVFDEAAMDELVASITQVGLLQPVVVRAVAGEPDRYELIMGERRWRASQRAGLHDIPAIVRETSDDALLRDALLENLHRAQLNPLEEAAAYQQLLEDFGCTHDELAQRIGRSRPQISNTIRLLRLSAGVQRRVAAGVLSAGHARALLAIMDTDSQDRLASRVVAEGISVRALEELVALGEVGTDPVQRPVRVASVEGQPFAERLAERFDTRVKVDVGKRKGKITIEFATRDDLERLMDLLDPSTP